MSSLYSPHTFSNQIIVPNSVVIKMGGSFAKKENCFVKQYLSFLKKCLKLLFKAESYSWVKQLDNKSSYLFTCETY